MDKTIKISYYNNGVGETKDCNLLVELLKDDFKIIVNDVLRDLHSIYVNGKKSYQVERIEGEQVDIGIYSNCYYHDTDDVKIKILILNEEWLNLIDHIHLRTFDIIIVKSKYAENILKGTHPNIKTLYFWSEDRFDPTVKEEKEILHLSGMSIQKGTESLVNREDITILDGKNNFKGCRSNYINGYQSDVDITKYMNKCNLHVCPSLYEAHGHYMFEGLSCGKSIVCTRIPVWEESVPDDIVTYVDVEEYASQYFGHNPWNYITDHVLDLSDSQYHLNQKYKNKKHWRNGPYAGFDKHPFRKSFTFDEEELYAKIEERKNDSFSEKRRNFCLDLNKKRSEDFRNFIVDLL